MAAGECCIWFFELVRFCFLWFFMVSLLIFVKFSLPFFGCVSSKELKLLVDSTF